MSKIYEVKIPTHHKHVGTYTIVAANAAAVKKLICKDLKQDRVPRGTVIEKTGLSKEKPSTSLLQNKSGGVSRNISSFYKKDKKPKKRKRKAPTDAQTRKKEAVKRKKELAAEKDIIKVGGYTLLKSEGIKLKRKDTFTNCTLYVQKIGDDLPVAYAVGEDAELIIRRSSTIWVMVDYTHGEKNIKTLKKHLK